MQIRLKIHEHWINLRKPCRILAETNILGRGHQGGNSTPCCQKCQTPQKEAVSDLSLHFWPLPPSQRVQTPCYHAHASVDSCLHILWCHMLVACAKCPTMSWQAPTIQKKHVGSLLLPGLSSEGAFWFSRSFLQHGSHQRDAEICGSWKVLSVWGQSSAPCRMRAGSRVGILGFLSHFSM